MSLSLPQHYLKNWLSLFYISSANEVIFLLHVLFDATVNETSLDFFFLAEDSLFFFSVICLFFFSWISLFMDVFLYLSYFKLVSDTFFPHQIFSNKKKAANNFFFSKGVEALLWVYFLFLSLSSVLSFFFVFLSFLSFSDNFNYNCYQLSIHHVPSNERAGLSTLELVKSGKSNFT